MNLILAAAAFAAAQAAPAAPVDHSQHSPAEHAQHQQGQHAKHQAGHDCCKEVDGKTVCTMMQGHGGQHQGHGQKQAEPSAGAHQGHAH